MASIDKRPNGKWRARWREYPGGPQKTRQFDLKIEAENYLTKVRHDLLTGNYVDPAASRITIADYSESWIARQHWRAATRDRVERELRLYILPEFGRRPLSAIRRGHIETWAMRLPLAPSSARRCVETLATMLSAAVQDELLAKNPASRARAPRAEAAPIVPLTVDQVHAIVDHTTESFRAAVVLASATGLRQGEAMAVTLDRIDFLRRELRVDRQIWTPSHGAPVFAPPKTRKGYRTVAISSMTAQVLAAHVENFRPGDHGLLFHVDGHAIGRTTLTQRFRRAATAAGVEATWHDLRHHHASLLLSKGVSPALVAERLGHDVKTLLSTYAHVIRSDEDRVRAIVDDVLGSSAEDWLRTAEA